MVAPKALDRLIHIKNADALGGLQQLLDYGPSDCDAASA